MQLQWLLSRLQDLLLRILLYLHLLQCQQDALLQHHHGGASALHQFQALRLRLIHLSNLLQTFL